MGSRTNKKRDEGSRAGSGIQLKGWAWDARGAAGARARGRGHHRPHREIWRILGGSWAPRIGQVGLQVEAYQGIPGPEMGLQGSQAWPQVGDCGACCRDPGCGGGLVGLLSTPAAAFVAAAAPPTGGPALLPAPAAGAVATAAPPGMQEGLGASTVMWNSGEGGWDRVLGRLDASLGDVWMPVVRGLAGVTGSEGSLRPGLGSAASMPLSPSSVRPCFVSFAASSLIPAFGSSTVPACSFWLACSSALLTRSSALLARSSALVACSSALMACSSPLLACSSPLLACSSPLLACSSTLMACSSVLPARTLACSSASFPWSDKLRSMNSCR
mmetsp:Transcript_152805/g.266964  ORF Transcript_152805/g.266964 Transcript_152805/m.266964 type:complete len:329 (-) Transcript_152805:1743-2729(-)